MRQSEIDMLKLQGETVKDRISELKRRVERLYDQWKYYDEPLTQDQLWEIVQETKKLTLWAD